MPINNSFRSCLIGTLFFFIALFSTLAQANPVPFFLMGDGKLHIQSVKTQQEAAENLIKADGSLDESALEKIDALFGFSGSRKGEHISARMLFMLDYFSDLVAPGKVIYLTSGYRSPEYNEGLKKAGGIVAKTSTHMDGLALDFYIDGVDGKQLWELIRQKNCCGVGHYGGKEIHLDASRPRFWEAATSGVDTNESDYNRRMYLSTDFDRYRPGQTLRLSLSSVSAFGFGIQKKAALITNGEGSPSITGIDILTQANGDCLPINDRSSSHWINLTLPSTLQAGRYRLRLDFCQRPFEQMPLKIISNEIEILSSGR